MKLKRKNEIFNKFGKINVYLSLIVFVLILSISIGYAMYDSNLGVFSSIALKRDYEFTNRLEFLDYDVVELGYNIKGDIELDNKELADGVNVITKVQGELVYNSNYSIKYTLYNGTDHDYTYLGSDGILSLYDYTGSEVNIRYPCIYGITKGDILSPGESRDVYIIFISDLCGNYNGSYHLTSEIIFSFKKGRDEKIIKPTIEGSLEEQEIILNNNNIASLKLDIINLFDCSKEFSLSLSNDNLELISTSGDHINISRIISRNTEEEISITVRLKNTFYDDITTDVLITTKSNEVYKIGVLRVLRDDEEDMEILDNFEVSYDFSYMSSWEGHSSLSINLVNNNDFDIEQYRIRLAVNSDSKVIGATSSKNQIELEEARNLVIIKSNNPYVENYHVPILANGSLVLDDIVLEHQGEYLECVALEIDALIDGTWHLGMKVNGISPIDN